VASSAPQFVTYTNGAARAASLVAGRGALPVGASDTAIHPVNYWNAGLQAAGLPYTLVGHSNGAVVPADTPALHAAKAAHAAAGGAINPNAGAYYAGYPYGQVAYPSSGAIISAEPVVVSYNSGAVQATRAAHLTYTNGAARAATLIAGRGALPVGVSDTTIHPVNYWNAGLQAAGLNYALVGHTNGAVVPVDTAAVQAARAAHIGYCANCY